VTLGPPYAQRQVAEHLTTSPKRPDVDEGNGEGGPGLGDISHCRVHDQSLLQAGRVDDYRGRPDGSPSGVALAADPDATKND
jgi:hypothetical protein